MNKNFEPATGPQLRLIALLTAQMRMREPRVESQAEAGRLIRELYREREWRKKGGHKDAL